MWGHIQFAGVIQYILNIWQWNKFEIFLNKGMIL